MVSSIEKMNHSMTPEVEDDEEEEGDEQVDIDEEEPEINVCVYQLLVVERRVVS